MKTFFFFFFFARHLIFRQKSDWFWVEQILIRIFVLLKFSEVSAPPPPFSKSYVRYCSRVARIWKRGGLFWKSEKCANDLDSNFHWPWISFRRFVRNLRWNVSERSEIQSFFRSKLGDLQKKKKKKKKGLRQNSEWFFGRNPKFKRFFRPKLGDLQKKKKVFAKLQCEFFFQFRKFKRMRGALFVWGGAVFHFSQKIGLKSTKNMRFCILHKPMGGLEPPPPPWLRYCATGYATLELIAIFTF